MAQRTYIEWLWTTGVHSENTKTGKIPTAYPADRDAAWESCDGCALRAKNRHAKRVGNRNYFYIDPEDPRCYFWTGYGGRLVLKTLAYRRRKGRDFSLTYALANRLKSVRAVRMSGGGDSSGTEPGDYAALERQVRNASLAWLDYTHFWRTKGSWLKGHALASCDTWDEAIAAVKAGWRAAVHVPKLEKLQGKIDGIPYTLCPAQRGGRKKITCNTCRLCDAAKPIVPIIVFLNH